MVIMPYVHTYSTDTYTHICTCVCLYIDRYMCTYYVHYRYRYPKCTCTVVRSHQVPRWARGPIPLPTYLDSLSCVQLLGWRDSRLSLFQELENEVSDVRASNGDLFDATSDNVSLSNGDDMGHSISRIDDSSGKGSLADLFRRPRSCKC